MSGKQHLDRTTLQELRTVMGDDFTLLIQTFIKDSTMRIAAIQQAAGDAEALRRAAHSFKGSSGNMGAQRLADLCRALEELARTGTTEGSEPLIDELAAEYAAVERDLNELSG
jgi:HPt (histidine-containing phosphotransfer) domain-containing protein